jgi:hypothetical protein
MEARRFEQAKAVTENRKQLFVFPARDRSRIVQAGLSMLLAASYIVLGLVLLMLQALAYLGS